MTETRNELSKGNIRCQMNLVFSMMRFLATILNMAPDSEMVCETLVSMAKGVAEQADVLCHDVNSYVAALTEERSIKTNVTENCIKTAAPAGVSDRDLLYQN